MIGRFEIEPEQFVERYENGELNDALVVDVREQEEWDYYHLEASKLIPLQSLPERLEELPKDKRLYVICAHGVRSVRACNFLLGSGYTNVMNVRGGMAAVSGLRGFEYD